jgi:three-Cys-motif partner protein
VAVEHDEIGIWSEVKLAIVKEYASAYTKIMDAQRRERIPSLRWFYIDGYAGSGHHVSKTRGDLVEGSPLIALYTAPPFHEYHFIDSDTGRAAELRKEAGNRPDVFTYNEDCNTVLLTKVFPRADYGQYKRALLAMDMSGFFLSAFRTNDAALGRRLMVRRWLRSSSNALRLQRAGQGVQ